MLSIPYTSRDFPPSLGTLLQGPQSLECTWEEIAHAAMTVGRANWLHVLQHGRYSAFELVYRLAMVHANLRQTSTSRLVRSPAYEALDPSEKAAVSYYLGLMTAKLFSERLLGTPWLMHLDVYQDMLALTLTAGKERPDLIGMTTQCDWIVIESKGRTGPLRQGVLEKGKRQTRRLRRIAGKEVALRIAMVTYFQADTLSMSWLDPDEYDADVSDLDINPSGFVERYYQTIINLLESAGDQVRELRLPTSRSLISMPRLFQAVHLPEVDMTIGLDMIARFLVSLGDDSIVDYLAAVPSPLYDVKRTFVGKDGVIVQLGDTWSEASMMMHPNNR